jgi:hypothetical protein
MNVQLSPPSAATRHSRHTGVRSAYGVLQRKCACGQHTGAGGECEECKKKRVQRKPGNGTGPDFAPAIVQSVLQSPGQSLAPEARSVMETHFEQDFSGVRVHSDAQSAESARAVNALAYTVGNHVVFGTHQYAPNTPAGQHLIAHELTHTLQQRGVSPSVSPLRIGPANDPAEADAERHAAATVGNARQGVMPGITAPQIQFQNNRDALKARLKVVQDRLAKLRKEYTQLSDDFADSISKERQRESLQKGTKDLKKQARSETAGNTLWGGKFARERILKVASLSQSGNTATISANFQISYLALSDKKGRERAAIDIPRIEATIRDVWQVDIASEEYAGISFRFQPKVTYLPKGNKRAESAFLIEVRGADNKPSEGFSNLGTISLAPTHLEGARVVVLAHELAHLFGFTDMYAQQLATKKLKEQWAVGRFDPAGRPDLLGLIDPVKLAELEKKGAVLSSEVKRQTGKVHIWDEEANVVLRILGATPLLPQRPSPDSEDFDPADELDRQKREGEAKLAPIREKTRRIDNSMKSLEIAEEIMRLEKEETSLKARLSSTP